MQIRRFASLSLLVFSATLVPVPGCSSDDDSDDTASSGGKSSGGGSGDAGANSVGGSSGSGGKSQSSGGSPGDAGETGSGGSAGAPVNGGDAGAPSAAGGSAGDSGAGGDPGSAGDSGTGGDPGAGGSSEPGDGGQCEFPECLAFAADCVTEGDCTISIELDGTTPTTSVCWENGVKAQTTASLEGSVMTFKKSDGSLCYSIHTSIQGDITDPEGIEYEWRNADDDAVATGYMDVETGILTIQCDGKEYEIDPEACEEEAPANGTTPDSSTCSMGSCSF
ncbi:MAG TPA: hypothetical protein VKY73_16690 [Polyangiaceae bacterium]|nr:hypothetical protein [Polyangiaceae bacterium]